MCKRIRASLIVLLASALAIAGCTTPSGIPLQVDETYSNTEVFISWDGDSYNLALPELIWSGMVPQYTFGFVGVSPNGDVYLAPQEYTLSKIENGEAVQSGDYNPSGFGGACGFSFSPDGSLFFVGNVGSVGQIFKVVGGRLGDDTLYYQREFNGSDPNYIRGIGFSPDGTLYFTDEASIYVVKNGSEKLFYPNVISDQLGLNFVQSMTIAGDGAIYFTAQVWCTTGKSEAGERYGWGGSGPSGAVCKLDGDSARIICAAINQEARGIAVGPDNSLYILTWIGDSNGNTLRLWRLRQGVEILQTDADVVQARTFVAGRTGYDVYAATSGQISEFQGENNKLNYSITNEVGNTTDVIIGIPLAVVGNPSGIRVNAGGIGIGGRVVKSETMCFAVFSYTQAQASETLTITW